MMTVERKVWMSEPPKHCEVCSRAIKAAFVDGATQACNPGFGRWVIMCLACHSRHGVGLGKGCGQQYERQIASSDESKFCRHVWVKVQG